MRLGTAIAIFTSMACPFHAQNVNRQCKRDHRVVRTALIMPVGVNLVRDSMKGGEGATEASEQVARTLYEAVSAELASRGVTVLPRTAAALHSDQDRYALADVERRYTTVARLMYRRPGGVKNGRYTLGDEIAAWPPAAQADTLVFVQAGGAVPTAGKQVFGWMVLGPRIPNLTVKTGFVDARSGTVLALANAQILGNATRKSEDALQEGLRFGFMDLPLPNPAPRR